MNVIDRRSQSKHRSVVNRDKFLKRFKDHIKGAVKRAIEHRDIRDIEQKTKVRIPSKDLREPNFGFDKDGAWERVIPGNQRYNKGDNIDRPPNSSSSGRGGSNNPDTFEEEFQFELSKEEFMNIFFEDLELPNMVKESLKVINKFKNVRAGYKKDGVPSNLNVLKSLRCALGRRIALGAKSKREMDGLLDDELLDFKGKEDLEKIKRIKFLDRKLSRIPFIDPIDLRYSNRVQIPDPSKNAVMFCLMDVSASMAEHEKDIAKRFFILLYLFLTKSYEKVDIIFIKHHTEASEVTEEDFFYGTESGGTVVSTALNLTKKIIDERYQVQDWNIYVAQASDGDSWGSDGSVCRDILLKQLMPIVQFFSYIEIANKEQDLWNQYGKVEDSYVDSFSMGRVNDVSEIYQVFRSFFERQS